MPSTTSVHRTLLHPMVTYPHYSCLVSSNTITDFPESSFLASFGSERKVFPSSITYGTTMSPTSNRQL
ncbi:hypothetical protein TNCV_1947471 [Trichonephila clavipes]|nr:hypothetical protein TNCV_1947471 [Trichonephila clavipes]